MRVDDVAGNGHGGIRLSRHRTPFNAGHEVETALEDAASTIHQALDVGAVVPARGGHSEVPMHQHGDAGRGLTLFARTGRVLCPPGHVVFPFRSVPAHSRRILLPACLGVLTIRAWCTRTHSAHPPPRPDTAS
jgi:hypothetical protein